MLMLRSEDRSVVMLLCDCLFCLVHSFGLFFILFNVRELFFCFFFFSSRRRHTRWTGDWSSDVCSSDLLVINWTRELRMWAEDVPYEVIGGDTQARKASWFVSKCPLKLVNYELLTRDAAWVTDEGVGFDVVVLDEAQRIKNKESKTAQVVRGLRRERSWAMTGTPIENRTEDLVNLFAFIDPGRIPPETP